MLIKNTKKEEKKKLHSTITASVYGVAGITGLSFFEINEAIADEGQNDKTSFLDKIKEGWHTVQNNLAETKPIQAIADKFDISPENIAGSALIAGGLAAATTAAAVGVACGKLTKKAVNFFKKKKQQKVIETSSEKNINKQKNIEPKVMQQATNLNNRYNSSEKVR